MNFDVNRLARLAGLSSGDSGTINEASNRSLHDEKSLSDEADYRFGKNQLAEMDELDDDLDEIHEEDPDSNLDDDVVLEIDEGMLRKEIRNMRQSRIQENKLRSAIRGEIQDIFEDLGIDHNSSWVYGDNKPKNSKEGFVNVMFPGIEFR